MALRQDAAEVLVPVVALDVDDELACGGVAPIVELAADDEAHAAFCGLFLRAHHAVEAIAIGDGDGVVPSSAARRTSVLGGRAGLEEREARARGELDVSELRSPGRGALEQGLEPFSAELIEQEIGRSEDSTFRSSGLPVQPQGNCSGGMDRRIGSARGASSGIRDVGSSRTRPISHPPFDLRAPRRAVDLHPRHPLVLRAPSCDESRGHPQPPPRDRFDPRQQAHRLTSRRRGSGAPRTRDGSGANETSDERISGGRLRCVP